MPFIMGAAGNVPTENAVNMFESMGVDTGIENTLIEAVAYLETTLNRSLPGRVNGAIHFQKSCDA
jgi:hydroxymethylglutaryl-CoA lyase